MRITIALLAASAGLACLQPPAAQAQIPSNLLQQLLPGGQSQNQNQGQGSNVEAAIREAYERGYRAGRQDQERSNDDRNGRSAPQNGNYQGQGNQRNQYGR